MKIDCPVLILCGGFGTRLRPLISNVPKPMAQFLGKPFLHYLIEDLISKGAKQIILSTGYMAEVIENYPWPTFFPKVKISFLRENTPLGPGGAVLLAFSENPKMSCLWVCNGDTFIHFKSEDRIEIGKSEVAHYLSQAHPPSPNNIANLVVENNLVVDPTAKVKPTHFDTGMVFVTREVLLDSPPTPCSLHDIVAFARKSMRVGHSEIDADIYDIGTPEKYKDFETFLRSS